MKTVAFVPIKLHSSRLANKNILPLGNKPLCWYIFSTLLQVKGIDEIYVYCSDEKILEYIPDGICFLKRDSRLDGDLIKGAEIYQEFINTVYADNYILAHATSPFIKVESIENSLNKVLDDFNDSAFSAQRIQTFAWFKGRPINYRLEDVPRTQDLEPLWVETSAFFIFSRQLFVEQKRRIGDRPFIQEVSNREAIDIDEKEDYELACKLLNKVDL